MLKKYIFCVTFYISWEINDKIYISDILSKRRLFMEEKKIITIQGKAIDYSKLSDEKLLKLYRDLKERENVLCKRIIKYNETYNFLPEIN